MPSFYEFFAGGGMARLGLGAGWTCLFANDFDFKKGLTYQANFGAAELKVADIRQVTTSDLPGVADLVWGSFPCQDLSLAGLGAGLKGERSGTFYPFWDVIAGLQRDGRSPRIIAMENVCGTLTSHGGKDLGAICATFDKAGYRYGLLVVNADLYVPQSRPRLFVIGVRDDVVIDPALLSPEPLLPFHTRGLCRAMDALPVRLRRRALWWNLPTPIHRVRTFADEIEEAPTSVAWHTPAETQQLLGMMSPINRAKVTAATRAGRRMVGGVYAFFDYDGEPIYVGQTNERLRTRIRRHLTNQRTDAVAMSVLDPFEVLEIEVWPLLDFQDSTRSDLAARQHLDALERLITERAIAGSQFKAILNEKDPPPGTLTIEAPLSHRGRIVSDRVFELRSHPDFRLSRRALIISRLAQVISERKVQGGLRRVLLTQSKRLQWLATRRCEALGGSASVQVEGAEEE